jgi:transposase InsO family protein
MCRLKPEQRLLLGKLARDNIPKKLLMTSFSVSRTTVWFWGDQNLHYIRDINRNYISKITIEAEITILFLRSLGYGCARIQQRLNSAPEIELNKTEIFIQGLIVSRQTIYNVLKKHKLNGYSKKNKKAWKFFRAKYANELWQLDLKEFKFEGKKYYFVVCIDDYSRFLLTLKLFEHCPTTKEITFILQNLNNKSEKILTDNGSQFREQWKNWCIENKIEPIFAHPYYPQDKGKVERTNRNIAEEVVNIIIIFHKLLNNQEIESWIKWFNEKRYHRGVKAYPAELYVKY